MTRDPRELIRKYRESEWRTTRLEVIRQLGDFQDSRSFLFLSQLIQSHDDLAEQRLAIASLSKRKSSSVRLFLRRYYPLAPDSLKATLAHSLGLVHDVQSVKMLLSDWDLAYLKQDGYWLRNIILALGELKAFTALGKLHDLFHNSKQPMSDEILFASLFTLGRLCRNPVDFQKMIDSHSGRFSDDGLLFQVYQGSLSQVQIRSQFRLEDYLNKLFTLPDPHPSLPLELMAFDPDEVDLGLSLFDPVKDWKRFLLALNGVLPERRSTYWIPIVEAAKLSGSVDDLYYLFDRLKDLGLNADDFERVESVLQPVNFASELKLKWLESSGRLEHEAMAYLKNASEELSIRWINAWNEECNGTVFQSQRPEIAKMVDAWLNEPLHLNVKARLIRACAELGLEITGLLKGFKAQFSKAPIRASLLLYAERFSEKIEFTELVESILSLKESEWDSLGIRLLSVLESYAARGQWDADLDPILRNFENHFNIEMKSGVIRILAHLRTQESFLLKQLTHENEMICLNAIIALKNFDASIEAAESLIPFLDSGSEVLRGRALDSLCSNQSLKAKQAVIRYLKLNLNQDEVVDKVFRCFDPQKKGGEGFVKSIDEILAENPDHSQWEKLVSLRDRISTHTKGVSKSESMNLVGQDALKELDRKLIEVIPQFSKLDPTIQSALRAAEQPFQQAIDLQNLPVDKAPTVLEYCKALDLILERHLGQKFLFPKLDQRLHEFQTLWHQIGFSEDYPPVDKVILQLGLKNKIPSDQFPLHKAKMMCATFFNGKITQDRFKIFDGLRAWAVIFLVFARKVPQVQGTPIIPLGKKIEANDLNDQCIMIARKLMTLQDLRNPAAHRQTYTELASLKNVRNEAIQLVNTVLDLVI